MNCSQKKVKAPRNTEKVVLTIPFSTIKDQIKYTARCNKNIFLIHITWEWLFIIYSNGNYILSIVSRADFLIIISEWNQTAIFAVGFMGCFIDFHNSITTSVIMWICSGDYAIASLISTVVVTLCHCFIDF